MPGILGEPRLAVVVDVDVLVVDVAFVVALHLAPYLSFFDFFWAL